MWLNHKLQGSNSIERKDSLERTKQKKKDTVFQNLNVRTGH